MHQYPFIALAAAKPKRLRFGEAGSGIQNGTVAECILGRPAFAGTTGGERCFGKSEIRRSRSLPIKETVNPPKLAKRA